MRLVLGIDPGTATTGFGLVRDREDGSLESIAYGTNPDPRRVPLPINVVDPVSSTE